MFIFLFQAEQKELQSDERNVSRWPQVVSDRVKKLTSGVSDLQRYSCSYTLASSVKIACKSWCYIFVHLVNK